jgi:Cu/Ag efflux pump CusA
LAETTVSVNRSPRGLSVFRGSRASPEQIGRPENGQDPDAPTRASQGADRTAHGRTAGEIDSAIRDVFDDFPNQLVEIYSVLAERIGETLSGESAPFTISVIGSDLDADDEVGTQIVAALQGLRDSGSVRLTVPPREAELQVELRPERLTQYGLQAADVLQRGHRRLSRQRGGRTQSGGSKHSGDRAALRAPALIRTPWARCCCAAATGR